jgi:ABC-2 type transport system permease protein
VARRIFLDLKNDRRTLALIFLAPIIAMFLFGLAFSGEVRDVRVLLVNNDAGYTLPFGMGHISVSRKIMDHIDPKVLRLSYLNDIGEAKKKAADGEASAVIYFEKDFTANVMRRQIDPSFKADPAVRVMIDRSNVNIAEAVLRSVARSVEQTLAESKRPAPLRIDTSEALFARDAKFMDFFVPGIMSFVVYLLTTLLTLLTFVNERTTGTLERLLSTPLREGEIVAGYCVSFSVIGMIQAGILLSIGIAVFDILIAGNLLLAFLVIVMLAVSCQSLGILLSSIAHRELQAIQLFPLIALPGFLLGGVFWPVEAIPEWLRPCSYILPITYAVDACRSVILRGWGFEKIMKDLAVLLGFAAVFLALAMISLRRRG